MHLETAAAVESLPNKAPKETITLASTQSSPLDAFIKLSLARLLRAWQTGTFGSRSTLNPTVGAPALT